MTTALQDLESRLQASVSTAVIGMQAIVRALTTAVVARGHVLVQGVPGLGKTLLSKSLAAALGGRFKRIQGTADLMPSDIIGVHVFDAARGEFAFRRGPLFADVLLFDEINRAGPKTQSALLEAMEERQVTVDNHLYALPPGFLVIATQNPREFEGTYPLPESQLDRFMLRLDLKYPGVDDELAVLARYGSVDAHAAPPVDAVVAAEQLAAARAAAEQVHVSPELSRYVLQLAAASREHPQLSLGLSTRGALSVLRAARIGAGLDGAEFVTPDDVRAVLGMVAAHRLVLAPDALLDGVTEHAVVAALLEQVPAPR
jgi:MoxR-like ATPase